VLTSERYTASSPHGPIVELRIVTLLEFVMLIHVPPGLDTWTFSITTFDSPSMSIGPLAALAGGAVTGGRVAEPEGAAVEQAVRTTSSDPTNTTGGNQRDLCVTRLNEIAVLPLSRTIGHVPPWPSRRTSAPHAWAQSCVHFLRSHLQPQSTRFNHVPEARPPFRGDTRRAPARIEGGM
jgi:hypothetical protein